MVSSWIPAFTLVLTKFAANLCAEEVSSGPEVAVQCGSTACILYAMSLWVDMWN